MKKSNKGKILTIGQLESIMQATIDTVKGGMSNYTKSDVLSLIKLVYNTCLKEATKNFEDGYYIGGSQDVII